MKRFLLTTTMATMFFVVASSQFVEAQNYGTGYQTGGGGYNGYGQGYYGGYGQGNAGYGDDSLATYGQGYPLQKPQAYDANGPIFRGGYSPGSGLYSGFGAGRYGFGQGPVLPNPYYNGYGNGQPNIYTGFGYGGNRTIDGFGGTGNAYFTPGSPYSRF